MVRARTSEHKPVMRVGSVAPVVAAVVIVGVLVAIGVSAVAGSPGRSSSSTRVKKEVSALLSGIPQNGDTLGQAEAPITLQIFGDLESEDVRTFVVWLLPNIIREWVRTNTVKIQYLSFMTASLPYPNVFVDQQVAALAAGAQNRLWNFIEIFYHEQGKEHTRYVSKTYLDSIARQIPGLNLQEWENDRETNLLAKRVEKEDHAAHVVGFHITPTFLIGRTGVSLITWPEYRLYEEKGTKKGFMRRLEHPLSFMTSRILGRAIERLP